MKRLERKIDIAEREYLSLLHSLGLAKLRQQNVELKSNLKLIEVPFFLWFCAKWDIDPTDWDN